MIEVNQQNSDKMWDHYQDKGIEVFDLSYPRLRFLAKCCLQGSMVLNVGVGSGYLESILMHRGVVAHSIDPSGLTINRLNEEQGMKGRAKQGYCHAIPFPNGFFDCVIMSEVLEHIPKNFVDASLREVRRVLKSGGRFIGTVPYREVLRNNEVFCPQCQACFHRWGHLHSFNLESLKCLLESNGMLVEKMQKRAFPDFSRPNAKLFLRSLFRYILGRMGESVVGPNIYFSCRI